jgi:hypothetical protein
MLKNPFLKQLFGSFMDLAPILGVVLVFQVFIVRQPIPDVGSVITGTFFVILGLTFFIQGLEQSLFPIGEAMAYAFARKGSLFWLLAFAFFIGFGAAVAEPGLISLVEQAANIASKGRLIEQTEAAKSSYALGLRLTVALSIGLAIVVGVLRIIKGWPVYYPVLLAYLSIAVMTPFVPVEIIGVAYDSGVVATSSITAPLLTVLGVGLATSIKGRHPVADGFGLIVLAALMSTIFVMVYGMSI